MRITALDNALKLRRFRLVYFHLWLSRSTLFSGMYIMVLLLKALYCVSNVRMISHQTQKCLLRKLSIRWIVFILNSSRKTLNKTTRNKKTKQKENLSLVLLFISTPYGPFWESQFLYCLSEGAFWQCRSIKTWTINHWKIQVKKSTGRHFQMRPNV